MTNERFRRGMTNCTGGKTGLGEEMLESVDREENVHKVDITERV